MTAGIRIGLVIEQALGHLTHAENLRVSTAAADGILPQWIMIPYQAGDVWDRLPGLSFSMRLSLRARSAVRKVLSRQPLDCLYFHTQNLSLFSPGLMKRIPAVVSLDATPANFESIAAAYGSTPSGGIAGRIKSDWFRRIFALAKGLVAMSDWVKSSLVQDYAVAPGKIRIIPFSVNVDQWQFVSRRSEPGRRMRLLFVGGDFERKGGGYLIDAFQHGLADFCELDIVTKEKPSYSGRHVRVHCGLTPNSDALKRLYAQADLFVLPTRGDATPLAILEAMASGLPVITTNVGAIGELVQESINGHFVRPADPQGIVDVVSYLYAHRESLASMGHAARAVVARDFNAETNSRHLIAFLKEISSPQPSGNDYP